MLRDVRPGLRLINKSNAVAKVQIHVAPGDEVEVSDEVAAQIVAESGAFVDAKSPEADKAVPYPPVEDVVVADEVEPSARPAKRAAKKARG